MSPLSRQLKQNVQKGTQLRGKRIAQYENSNKEYVQTSDNDDMDRRLVVCRSIGNLEYRLP